MTDYEARKDRERDRQAKQSRTGRDIGPLKKCESKRRRDKAAKSLRVYCETYFKPRFPLPWSDDHLEQLAEIERVITNGGLQAIAAPRGDGKTTRLECGILWGATAIAAHDYVVLLSAVSKQAPKLMSSIKVELANNDILLADFPEICQPIRALNGIAQKAGGMLLDGANCWPSGGDKPWARTRIVLPTVAGSACSGTVIEASGLLEATRGIKYTRADGTIARPTLALIDDPQTNRSAKSAIQCQERLEAITGGILYLPGPSNQISAFAAVTVIKPGDLADELLKRDVHPEWHGIRKKFFDAWPLGCDPRDPKGKTTAEAKETAAAWDEYAELYRADIAAGGSGDKATARYKRRRKVMDRGAKPAWTARHPGCASAIEYGMRLFFRDRSGMLAEFQQDPDSDSTAQSLTLLTVDQIERRVNGYAQAQIPIAAQRLTAFVDVHKELLYYVVIAWAAGFTGYVIDYGTWPKQSASHFELRHCRQPISKDPTITATTLEGRVTQALHAVLAYLATREWKREDGVTMVPELTMIDANWGECTDVVYTVCAQAQRKHGLRVMPSHGVPFGPSKRPIARWPRKTTKGAVGELWHVPPPSRGRAVRHVLFDHGRSLSFVHRRLATPAGDTGSLTLYHAQPGRHRLIAEHLTAERGETVKGPYGELVAWSLLPGRDNHWLDCVSGAAIAESILGGKLAAPESVVSKVAPAKTAPKKKRERVKYLDI